jgi:rSAM/selenodomain-associated transferase 1
LRPTLSEEQCLELHLAFLKDTLQCIRQVDAQSYLYLSDEIGLPFSAGIPVRMQTGSDLGQRMENAFREVLRDHDSAVIVGTDSPTLTPSTITAAFQELDSADLVLGPTDDGGYYLIAAKVVIPQAFREIAWGTAGVLAKTIAALEPYGYKVTLLETSYDIDLPADLERLAGEQQKLILAKNTLAWLKSYGAR